MEKYRIGIWEAAQIAHVSQEQIRRAVEEGRLQMCRSPKWMFWPEEVLAAFSCFACGAPPDDRRGWEDGPDGPLCPDCGDGLIKQAEELFP